VVPPSDVPIPRLPAPAPEVSKPSVPRSVPIDDAPVPVTDNVTISWGRLDAIEAMLLQLQATANPVHAGTDATLPTIDINTATAPAAASAADSGRFKLALSHTKFSPFSGDAMTDAMSFENWLLSHLRNVAGVNSDSDVLVMAAKHLRGAALRTHMNVTREADVTDAAHFATWHQIMKDAFPGPSASQRQSIYHSARYTADLGSAQAWRLEAERVMRLIPGLPKPTDGPVYHVALVAKFVAGLPATVCNFIESVRHITDDPATCADINDLVLVAQRSLVALPPDQLAANTTTPAIATVGHCDTPCLTPSCAQPTTHSMANCHWWLAKRKLQDNIDAIQKNIDSGTYKRQRNSCPSNNNGKNSHTVY
jgi:hypothetical protein